MTMDGKPGRRRMALLAACLGLSSFSFAAEPRELTVWAMGEEGKKIQALARRFEAENPGVTVQTQAIPWGAAHEKLLTSVVGGIPPDVCQLGTTWMAEFASMEALEDMEPWIRGSSSLKPDDFFKGSWDTCLVNGRAYGVPWYVDTRVLFYRKDLLAQAGFKDAPRTWEELKTVSRALKALPSLPDPHYALTLGVKDWGALLMFVWQNGGDALQPTKAAFQEALDFYVSFFREGLTPADASAEVDLLHAFRTGYFPMFISGPWMVDMIQKDIPELDGRWGVAVLPSKQTPTSFVGGSNLVLFKGSRNKELAWRFMEFMSRPEVQVEWYQIIKDLPSRRSAWDAPEFRTNPMLNVFGRQMQHVRAPPNLPEWEEIAQATGVMLEKAVLAPAESNAGWKIETDRLQLAVDVILHKREGGASWWDLFVFGLAAVLATLAVLFWAAFRTRGNGAESSRQPVSFQSSPKAGYLFILPACLVLVVFLFAPICVSFFLSLTDLDVFGINNWKNVRFIGFQNYRQVLYDPVFWKALFNTFCFALAGVPMTIGAALLAAVALNHPRLRFRTFFRVSYFAPVVTTIVAVAVVWRWLYNPDYGLINWMLGLLGLPAVNWLSDARTALFSLILMAVWKNFGYYMVVFSAGLQTIPESLYEAARMDGASSWQCFRHITLPGLRPTMLFVMVLTGVTYLQFFAEPYIMTKGGPLNATNSIVLYMYDYGFKFFRQGYASAVAYILFGIIFVVTLVQLRLKKEGFETNP